MLDIHSAAIQEGLGKLKDHKAKIILDSQTTQLFYEANHHRLVPYILKTKVQEEQYCKVSYSRDT